MHVLAGKDHNTVPRLVDVADQSWKLLLGPYTIFLVMLVGQLVVRHTFKNLRFFFVIIFRVKVTANLPEKRIGEPTANQRTILGMVFVAALTSILTHNVL